MVFLSPYKSHRILGRDFLLNAAIKHRDRLMYVFARPWATGAYVYVTDCRPVITVVCVYYFMQRFKHGRSIEEDEFQRTTIKRWGNSVDNVRKQLTPGDQVRVRTCVQQETYYGCMLPTWVRFQPEGHPWPGPAEGH
eukprot:CAMPEP_0174826934 /NCGR_PEP_ID=MMETSP1114-20130205/339_1 /TAXON_ID=312471 /ORGANISM="Neobodo designis, Strain CCAP 1951/1" /LENGTH=136 /DNA_ID=CAMNT_0016060507 /DNA_START=36 /DNA_END=446 /DNA_ORIENTATION=+